jgi:transcriptional regulator with XRE-family HTH domain
MTGNQIKRIRERLEESQAAFAARFGVNQATISRWERDGVPDEGPKAIGIEHILSRIDVPATSPRRQNASPSH